MNVVAWRIRPTRNLVLWAFVKVTWFFIYVKYSRIFPLVETICDSSQPSNHESSSKTLSPNTDTDEECLRKHLWKSTQIINSFVWFLQPPFISLAFVPFCAIMVLLFFRKKFHFVSCKIKKNKAVKGEYKYMLFVQSYIFWAKMSWKQPYPSPWETCWPCGVHSHGWSLDTPAPWLQTVL